MRTHTAEQALGWATRSHCLAVPGDSVNAVADQIVGLHNTSQVSPYLSMRARLREFEIPELETAMWARWDLVRFRAMRLTMFIFPVELLEIAAAATRHIAEPFAARWLRDSPLTQREFDHLAAAVLEALADGPLTSRQVREALGVPRETDVPGIVSRLCDLGKVVGGAPPGSWRSNIRQFHRWDDVLPHVDITRWSEEAAITELIRRYIGAYGPVTLSDMAWWSGLSKTRCRRALEQLEGLVHEVAVNDWSGPLYGPVDAEYETTDGSLKALPLLDPYVQGYRDRQRFLTPRRESFVYDGGGNSSATIVHGGKIIGVWQPMAKPPTICYHLFPECGSGLESEVEMELLDTARTYFDGPVDLIAVSEMQPLIGPGASRSAAHPLDGVLHRGG